MHYKHPMDVTLHQGQIDYFMLAYLQTYRNRALLQILYTISRLLYNSEWPGLFTPTWSDPLGYTPSCGVM